MSWTAIARKDFRDAVRSRTLWLLLAAIAALFAAVFALERPGTAGAEFETFVEWTLEGLAPLLPIVGIVLGYKTVIHERESGTLLLSLSLPHDRSGFAVGKFVGRTAVLAVPVAGGLVVAGVLAAVAYDGASPLAYLAFVGASVLYGASFLSIALGISMSTTAGRRVIAGAFGAYLALAVLWTDLVELLVVILYRFDSTALVVLPDWALLLQLASPGAAYPHIVGALFGLDGWGVAAPTGTPWFVDSWTALAVLAGWIVVPIALGYLRFDRTDL